MTALIGGSVLLVVASTIALVFGWSTADESLIWTSIGASIGAGVLLIVAVVRSRKSEPVAAAAASRSETSERSRQTPPKEADQPASEASAGTPREASGDQPRPAAADRHPAGRSEDSEETAVATPARPAGRRKRAGAASGAPAAGDGSAETAATSEKPETSAAAASTARSTSEVIAVPDRKRFHRPSCRYASAKGAERMSKASARRRGYAACGVCKP